MADDPFRTTGPRRWPKVVGGGLTAAMLLVGGVLVATMEGPKSFAPEGLVGGLAASDWTLAVDGHGYRSLGTVLGPDEDASLVAVGDEGTLAVAMRSSQAVVVVWRGGRWRRHIVPESRTTTALAVDPEGRVHVGMQDGRLARIDPDGAIAADPAMVAGRNSVVAFAFDRESPKSAVMVAGGELHTGLRPFEAGGLNVVTMPEARIRIMAYDANGSLVVAGDSGTAYGSTPSGWEPRNPATEADAVAFGRDGHGHLLLAVNNGYVFREDGHRWEMVNRVARTPVAVGELPSKGIVVVASDGSFWGAGDGEELERLDPLVDDSVTAAVVAGHNVFAIAGLQLHVVDSGGRWSTTSIQGPARDCAPVTFDAPIVEPLVRCGTALHRVTAEGLEPASDPEGWNAARLAAATRRDNRRVWTWQHDVLWQARADSPLRFATKSELRRLQKGATDWELIAELEAPVGPVRAIDAHGDALWVASRSGSIYRADTTQDPVELMEVAAHESFVALHALTLVSDIEVVAHAAGVLVVHDTELGPRGTFVSEAGLQGIALPPVVRFFRLDGAVMALTPLHLAELTPAGLAPVPVAGLSADLTVGVTSNTVVRSKGAAFAFRVGDRLVQCLERRCRDVDLGPVHSFAPVESGDVVVREVGGRSGYLRWVP